MREINSSGSRDWKGFEIEQHTFLIHKIDQFIWKIKNKHEERYAEIYNAFRTCYYRYYRYLQRLQNIHVWTRYGQTDRLTKCGYLQISPGCIRYRYRYLIYLQVLIRCRCTLPGSYEMLTISRFDALCC